MRSKYCYEFMGWDGLLLLNISHNNISKMFKEGELEANIQVIHFIINYKIMLKAVTCVQGNVFDGGIVLPSWCK